MRARRSPWTIAALAAALAATACGPSGATDPQSAPRPSADPTGELERIYRERIESARSRYTEADVAFMRRMIGHHSQALLMSALAPTHGASPTIQTLAARIINAQQDEIATMERWLRDRGEAVPEIHIMGTEMHGVDHSMHMPGMLTPEQIRRLDEARGPEFDRLFLAHMIEHHRGAVTMVQELFRTDGAGQDEEVFKFAADVEADQSSEIARMELMLSSLTGEDPRR